MSLSCNVMFMPVAAGTVVGPVGSPCMSSVVMAPVSEASVAGCSWHEVSVLVSVVLSAVSVILGVSG